ncbi:MAG: YpmS family protein [Lacticaseibacillus paracasei]
MTEKKRQRKQKSISWSMINWWKWAFLILIGLILGSGVWFTKTVLAPVSLNTATETKTISNDPVFTVKVTKSSANRIMAHYLKTYLKDSPIKYAVTLGNNEAALNGSFKFLGNNVKFQLTFDPLVLKNGDVLLKSKKLNVGTLPVPISFVMSYIGHSYKIPSWVSLDSKAGNVVLRLSQFKLQNGMTLRATKLDPTNDDLEFAVYLPDNQ